MTEGMHRLEAREKITGRARYAFEYPVDGVAYLYAVQAAVGRGRIRSVGTDEAMAMPGVLDVLSCENTPRLSPIDNGELAVFQSREVSYRGQLVAAVVGETLETAQEAARLLRIEYEDVEHPDVLLSPDHPTLYKPDYVNPVFETDTENGDPEGAFAACAVQVDATYQTPAEHNNPMEPHAAIALWDDEGRLVVYDSNQGPSMARDTLAQVFGLDPSQVRVVSPHVGGGFGSKGLPRPNVVLAAMAAQMAQRPVKYAVTRQQMFATTGYRTPTIQRLRLGADDEGRLNAVLHEVIEQTSTVREFAEQTATCTRVMYGAPNILTAHRLNRLDVPTPSWMRAPGETPGMYALECAMDELATATGIDPIELRIRNDTDREPVSGLPFSSRNLVTCLREGAERFGWDERDPVPSALPVPGTRKLRGMGVAASTYPAYQRPNQAAARREPDGRYRVRIAASDIGTGARTTLTIIASEALKTEPSRVTMEIGDSSLPSATVAGGSSGTAGWGWAVTRACEALLADPSRQEAFVDTKQEVSELAKLARHAFGAHFAEVEVDADTGEVRVPRMLGVFAAGRIINPITAHSQFVGAMTMGLGMALLEAGKMDEEFGDYLNHDLAQYHVAACADVRDIDAVWLEEADAGLNPMGSKGIGEIGIVGAAAAIANAIYNATGVRIRDLPITPAKLLAVL